MNKLYTHFSQDYSTLEENYGSKFQTKSTFKINKVLLNNSCVCDNYISVHLPKSLETETFSKLRRFKYISIIQPERYYERENDQCILIYLDYLKYQLNEKNLEKQRNLMQIDRIILQLALLYAELEKRNYKWPLKYLEQLYYIDGLLYVSLADYDFNSPNLQLSCFDQFMTFSKKYFLNEMNCVFQDKNVKNLCDLVKQLCQKKNKYYDSRQNEICYQNVFKELLQLSELQLSLEYDGHCVVKAFQTPGNLLELHPELKEQNPLQQQCIFKVTKNQTDLWLKRIRREIDLMEENKSKFIVVCSLYFRILDTAFLIMKKYPYTLDIILKDWKPTEQTLKRDVYTFAYKFAIALNDLHKQRFQHRDLKPNNLFLNQNQLEVSDVFIGDLDRAKRNEENQIAVQQTDENQDNHELYNPPEEKIHEQKQYTYDVFQYGIILLEVANRGKYVGVEKQGPRMINFPEINTFDQYYSKGAISQKLSVFNYDEEFIDLIFQCLRKNPSNRIDSQEIYQKTEQLYQKNVQGLDQTVLETVKSKNKKLQQINPQDQQMIDQQNIGQDQIIQQNNQITLQPESQLVQHEQDQNLGEKIAKFQQVLRQHFKIENKQQ